MTKKVNKVTDQHVSDGKVWFRVERLAGAVKLFKMEDGVETLVVEDALVVVQSKLDKIITDQLRSK
jgi:hypothetical protein